jgi:hypothetical protein
MSNQAGCFVPGNFDECIGAADVAVAIFAIFQPTSAHHRPFYAAACMNCAGNRLQQLCWLAICRKRNDPRDAVILDDGLKCAPMS